MRSQYYNRLIFTLINYFRLGIKKKQARECGDDDILKGREPLQLGWYQFVSTLVQGQTVLDVGCGSGEGLKILSEKAKKAVGIDLDERLKRNDLDVQIKNLSEMPDKSFDAVTCIDVIEHVEDDKELVKQLIRVARRYVFVSTPNYALNLNFWPYHIREYTPREFDHLFSKFGDITVFGGDPTGEIVKEIKVRPVYYFINDLYCFKITVTLAKVMKRLLFAKVYSHQAVIVRLPGSS